MEDSMEENMDDGLCDRKASMMEALHAGPGIILLTTSMQLLYKDRRAWELCQQIIRCQDRKRANGVLPSVVSSLVDEIRKTLKVRTDPKDWEQIQVRRYVNTLHSSLFLCGTALIDQTNAEERIVIVISEVGIGAWEDTVVVRAKEKFRLTVRETTVVQHLLKGWTNKEIAKEMRLAEQTIKEHFKHIFEKTGSATRTGIVMKIIRSGLRQALTAPSPHLIVPTMSGMPSELVASA